MIIGIAGPYTAPTKEERKLNLNKLNEAAVKVFKKGHVPLIGINAALPFVQYAGLRDTDSISLEISLAIIKSCDALLFLAESPGANKERELIIESGKKVYYSIEEIPGI